MSLRVCAGIIDDAFTIPPGAFITIDEEDFQSSFGDWRTPGTDDPEGPWSRGSGSTPTGSTGPAGGSDPGTRAVVASNAYAYVEATDLTFDSWSLESQELDASAGTITLTFDFHMRFGSAGNIADGTLRVEGWNGTAWAGIGPAITGSQQTSATGAWGRSSNIGTFNSAAFSNPDFKYRFLFTRGTNQFNTNYDCALDNVKLVGPEDAVPAATATGFGTGLRRLHVSQDGTPPEDGSTPDLSFTTIQAGLNALQPGDVLTIADGRYFETLSLSNFPGTASRPCWIVAENRGAVIVSNLRRDLLAGTTTWRNEGGGIYSTPGSEMYVAWEGSDMLPRWFLQDLQDANFFATQSTSGTSAATLLKPDRGCAFANGRIFVKTADATNPSGQNISVTNGLSATQLRLTNSRHVIVDGLVFEGGGDGSSITNDRASINPTFRNLVFEGCQFGISIAADNTLVEWCEFNQVPGHTAFQTDLRTLNGQASNAIFRYHKDYYYGQRFGINNQRSDSMMEGGLDTAIFNGTPASNVRVTNCLMRSSFEGSKFGRHRSGEMDNCAFIECLDDGVELETASTNQTAGVGDIRLHDCYFENCFSTISHQGSVLHNRHFVYRNVLVADDPPVAHPAFFIKSIKTPGSVDIHYYHNTMINLSANTDTNDGFGSNHWVWFGFGAPNGDADKIKTWRSNIVVMPNDLDAAQTNPSGRQNNAVVSPANNAQSQTVQGTNGTYAGNLEASMALNADYSLGAGSPAIGAGAGSLPNGFPDSRSGAGSKNDAGAFPNGETPGPNWPRARVRTFVTTLPPANRWPSPGV